MNLDIGSGSLKNASSNTHIYLKNKNIIHVDIEKYSYHNEAQCTVYYLPFRNKIFNVVYLRHVLEHLKNPKKALKEVKRVGKNVLIQVPNAQYYKFLDDDKTHFFSWTPITLKNLLLTTFKNVKIVNSRRYSKKNHILKRVLFQFSCLILKNNEITAICRD